MGMHIAPPGKYGWTTVRGGWVGLQLLQAWGDATCSQIISGSLDYDHCPHYTVTRKATK